MRKQWIPGALFSPSAPGFEARLMAALCESDAECCGDLSSFSSSETGTEATEHESTSSCVPYASELARKRKVDHNIL